MLPTASTFTRACVVAVAGRVTACEPSFGVLAARVSGNVAPPSVDSRMLTVAVLIGAAFVPETFHVTVCAAPRGAMTAVFGAVTRNGAVRGDGHGGVRAVHAPGAGVVVAHRGSELHRAAPTVGRNSDQQLMPAGQCGARARVRVRRVREDAAHLRERPAGARGRVERAEQRAAWACSRCRAAAQDAAVVLLPRVREGVAVGVGAGRREREGRAGRDRERSTDHARRWGRCSRSGRPRGCPAIRAWSCRRRSRRSSRRGSSRRCGAGGRRSRRSPRTP